MALTAEKTNKSRVEHISYSKINEFLMCPKKYHLHRRLRMPPAFIPSALIFGISVHEAIALYHQKRLEGVAAGEDDLLETFCRCWDNTEQEKDLPVHYGKKEDSGVLFEKAEAMLRAYLDSPQSAGEPLAVEEWIEVSIRKDLPSLVGRIDLLEKTGDGQIVLTDFKTASSRRLQDAAQLVLYREALRLLGYPGAGEARLRCVVLLKTKTPGVEVQDLEAGGGRLEKLMSLYREAWEAIQAGVSYPRPDWQCKSCQWSHVCDQG